jgi:hypothetical protein
MNTRLPSGANYFRSLRILHLAILAGQAMFCAVAALLVFSAGLEPSIDDSRLLNVLVPLIAVGAVAASMGLFRRRLEAAQSAGPDQKLDLYRGALILRYAILEVPALLSIIMFMLTGTIAYLAVAGMLIAWFALQRPGRARAMEDLRMDEAGSRALEGNS